MDSINTLRYVLLPRLCFGTIGANLKRPGQLDPIVLSCLFRCGFRYMAKHVMLERGIDMAIREVRLGKVPLVNQEVLRQMVCEGAHILVDCEDVLLVEMRPVSTDTFDLPAAPATCINRGEEVEPMSDVLPGGSGEFMIVRVCSIQDPMFPSTGIGLQLRTK